MTKIKIFENEWHVPLPHFTPAKTESLMSSQSKHNMPLSFFKADNFYQSKLDRMFVEKRRALNGDARKKVVCSVIVNSNWSSFPLCILLILLHWRCSIPLLRVLTRIEAEKQHFELWKTGLDGDPRVVIRRVKKEAVCLSLKKCVLFLSVGNVAGLQIMENPTKQLNNWKSRHTRKGIFPLKLSARAVLYVVCPISGSVARTSCTIASRPGV